MKNILPFFAFLLVLGSCKKDPSTKIVVDPTFQPFVDLYVDEANKRGITTDFEKTGLSITFGDVPPNANGVCKGFVKGFSSAHEIVIHRNRWNNMNESGRERLIFHELGHCHLFRDHLTDTLSNGDWNSIMRGESPMGFGARGFNYSGTRKEYYLNELFKPETPTPDWATLSVNYNDISADQKETLIEQENLMEFFRSTDLSGNFEIELVFVFSNEFINRALSIVWGGPSFETAMSFSISGVNSLFIANRVDGYGVQRIFENYTGFRLGKAHTLSVQKIGERYYYFFDRNFLYWSDFVPLKSSSVQIIKTVGFDVQINSLTVKKLLN